MSDADNSNTTGIPTPKRLEKRKISALKSHPQQNVLFRPLAEEEFALLKANIKKNGIRQRIEVTDGVVIDGHQRLEAARQLGWEYVTVWVRDDLGDTYAVNRRHIEANRERRQLDTLDKMRLEIRLLELEKGRKPGKLFGDDSAVLKARLEKVLGKSGRSVQRWQNVLAAPMEIQRACSEGRLPMNLAEKVGQEQPTLKDAIAAAIRDGEDPTEAVKSRLRKPSPGPYKLSEHLTRLIKQLKDAMELLSGHEEEIERHRWFLENDLKVLGRFTSFSMELRKVLKVRKDEFEKEAEADGWDLDQ